MASIYFTDIIDLTKLPHDDLVAIRHSLKYSNARKSWDAGVEFFEEYQCIQPEGYFKNKKYIFSFVSGPGTTARFLGVYEIINSYPVAQAKTMNGFPLPNLYSEDVYYFEMKKLDLLEDLSERLVIDWGKGTNNIVHYRWEALKNKPVICIDEYHQEDEFPGYNKVNWDFSKMARLISDPVKYSDIYQALSRVNGVYLVLDPISHKQYVGSASGDKGIYGRWKTYAETKGMGGKEEDGANLKLAELLINNRDRYLDLQYSILETIPRTGNDRKDKQIACELESDYKNKLGTRNPDTGLNLN